MQSHRQTESCVIEGVFKASVAWYKLESIFLASGLRQIITLIFLRFATRVGFVTLYLSHHFFSLFPPALNILTDLLYYLSL